MPYYIFHQNALRGPHDYESPGCVVAVEASSHTEANSRLAKIGVKFDGRRWKRVDPLVNEPVHDLRTWMQKYGFRVDQYDHLSGMLELFIFRKTK